MNHYLTETIGDLLDFPANINIIAHSCNCQNVMGAGIASQMRTRYPMVWEVDCIKADSGSNTLGEISYTKIDDDKYIYNLYTQHNIGYNRQVNYEAFYVAVDKMYKNIKRQGINNPVVGVPFGISCKLAGGSWHIIKAMLEVLSNQHQIETYYVRNLKYDKSPNI